MPETPAPVAIVEAYHQAWTSGDVDRAMTLASELFTVDGERITSIHLAFDRLGYMPPQAA